MGSVCCESCFFSVALFAIFVAFLLDFSTSDPTGNILVQSVVYRQLPISFPSNIEKTLNFCHLTCALQAG